VVFNDCMIQNMKPLDVSSMLSTVREDPSMYSLNNSYVVVHLISGAHLV
jgi:hypothetical protein